MQFSFFHENVNVFNSIKAQMSKQQEKKQNNNRP